MVLGPAPTGIVAPLIVREASVELSVVIPPAQDAIASIVVAEMMRPGMPAPSVLMVADATCARGEQLGVCEQVAVNAVAVVTAVVAGGSVREKLAGPPVPVLPHVVTGPAPPDTGPVARTSRPNALFVQPLATAGDPVCADARSIDRMLGAAQTPTAAAALPAMNLRRSIPVRVGVGSWGELLM